MANQAVFLIGTLLSGPAVGQNTFRDCADCPEMAVIPAGSFMMGTHAGSVALKGVPESVALREMPSRLVRVEKPFALGTKEITLDQFLVFVTATDWPEGQSCFSRDTGGNRADVQGATWKSPGIVQTGQHPAVCVDFSDVMAYATWLTKLTGYPYRLPSEAEWEYAARAGTLTTYSWGDERVEACKYANVPNARSSDVAMPQLDSVFDCDDGYIETAPVGSFPSNGFGLHDMLGNVWEWVEDCWHPDYSGAPLSRQAWVELDNCKNRVVRGGGWGASRTALRVAARSADPTTYRGIGLGFRVSRDIKINDGD